MASSIDYKSNQTGLLTEHMENYNVETMAIHRKLQSKVEALKIMRTELEHYRTQRDQFKLMAETLQMRYSAIKKSLLDSNDYQQGGSCVAALVNETREKNIALTTEVEALRQKVTELEGDIRVLRQKGLIDGGSQDTIKQLTFNGVERSKIIAQMEMIKKKNAQLQYDFKSLLDEKEEVVTERDAYKCKVHRLNHELNVALKGNESQNKVLDLDALILENKLLHEKLKNVVSELEHCEKSCAKYKTMLDGKRKKGIMKFGTNQSDFILSHKQAKNLLDNKTLAELPNKAETIADLKSLCLALLDNLNDKSVALSHQKSANKILGSRITELEHRLRSFMCENSPHNENQSLNILSPCEMLLTDYTSSTVDQDLRQLTDEVGSPSIVTQDVLNGKNPISLANNLSGDSTNKSTSFSSSEYNLNIESDLSLDELMHTQNIHQEMAIINNNDGHRRNNFTLQNLDSRQNIPFDGLIDYEDLPPDTVDIIRQALKDMQIKTNNDE